MLEPIPDLAEPIVGYRLWSITSGYLRSLSESTRWPQGQPLQARCPAHQWFYPDPPHSAPGPPGCHGAIPREFDVPGYPLIPRGTHIPECGIYAYKHPVQLQFHLSGNYLIGEVYLWGKVYEYERGWRAEYAQPKTLYTHEGCCGCAVTPTEIFAERHGAEVVSYPSYWPEESSW